MERRPRKQLVWKNEKKSNEGERHIFHICEQRQLIGFLLVIALVSVRNVNKSFIFSFGLLDIRRSFVSLMMITELIKEIVFGCPLDIGHWTRQQMWSVVILPSVKHNKEYVRHQYINIILNVFLVEPFKQEDVAAAYSSCFPTILIYLGFLGLLLIKEKGS